jgi:hypothetical protein
MNPYNETKAKSKQWILNILEVLKGKQETIKPEVKSLWKELEHKMSSWN